MTVWYAGWNVSFHLHSTLHTRQSSTQNNKYQVLYKHSCFSWWWAYNRLEHVEIDKYTKNKLCTKLALFTRWCGVISQQNRVFIHTVACESVLPYSHNWYVTGVLVLAVWYASVGWTCGNSFCVMCFWWKGTMKINCRVTDSENMKWKTIQMRFIARFCNSSQVAMNF